VKAPEIALFLIAETALFMLTTAQKHLQSCGHPGGTAGVGAG
jgi:hypothetical protein